MTHDTCQGCGEPDGVHKVYGTLICEYAGERSQLIDADTKEPITWEQATDPIIESPSAWSYRQSQENGDDVDCYACGNALNDDFSIVNDAEGYAYHEACFEPPNNEFNTLVANI